MRGNGTVLAVAFGSIVLAASFFAGRLTARPAGESLTPLTLAYKGREIPSTIDEILDPKHTVLLVHEMLNDFISKGGAFDKRGGRIDADAIVPPIAKLIAAAHAKRVRVAYVRWTNHADGSTASDPMRERAGGQRTLDTSTVEGTWGWENPDAIKPAPGDWVLRKYRPDAFYATALDALLRWNGVRTIVFVGIGAEVGGIPTMATASNIGYFTVTVRDCIRPSDPVRMDDAVKYLSMSSTLKQSTELIDIWSRSTLRPAAPASSAGAAGQGGSAAQTPAMTYEGRRIPHTTEEILDPTHTALVVHEMLNDFISPGGGYDRRGRIYDPARVKSIVDPVVKLIATAREKKIRVVYLRYTSFADASTSSEPMIQSAGGKPGEQQTVDGTWGWENIDAVKPMPGDWIVRKHRRDGFWATDLDALLRWNGIKTIVFVGIGGELGGVATLMTADTLGYFRVAVKDGILTSNPARTDDAWRMIADHATVKTSAEVLEAWRQHPPVTH